MPFDVTVPKPDAGVVGAEPDDEMGVVVRHYGVPTHWDSGKIGEVGEMASARIGTLDGLKSVAVEMPGVEVVVGGVVIVEDDFDHRARFKDVGGYLTVDEWVGCVVLRKGESRIERGDFLGQVGGLVDYRSVGFELSKDIRKRGKSAYRWIPLILVQPVFITIW